MKVKYTGNDGKRHQTEIPKVAVAALGLLNRSRSNSAAIGRLLDVLKSRGLVSEDDIRFVLDLKLVDE